MRASYLQPSSLQYSSFFKEGGSKAGTLESLIIVLLVIKVPQSNGGVKIVLYDFLTAMSLS